MAIQINGVYEYNSGRTEIYRIYVYRKIRKYYKCFINQVGTERIIHENISGKWLKENCKYIGRARTTWEDLFQVYSDIR